MLVDFWNEITHTTLRVIPSNLRPRALAVDSVKMSVSQLFDPSPNNTIPKSVRER